MSIGTDPTQHALRPPPVPSVSAGARGRWLVGLLVTLVVAMVGGSAHVVSASLDTLHKDAEEKYERERRRIDRLEDSWVRGVERLGSIDERLGRMEARQNVLMTKFGLEMSMEVNRKSREDR